jgi:transposase
MILYIEWILHIKKEPKYKRRSEEARKVFIDFINQISPSNLVYCDEMGVSNNITTLYGWSEKGKRSYAEQIGFATEKVNIVAGYIQGTKELIAPLEHSGNMDKALFNQWICEHLCPALTKGQHVIMDNASIHKDIKVKEAIEKVGCTLVYLPTYSPDLNPIEHCWANFKNYLRKIIKKYDNIRDAITEAITRTFSC